MLVKHVDCEKRKRKQEHETLYDKAIIEYANKLDYGASKIPVVVEGSGSSIPTPVTLRMGWALKSPPSRRTKLTDKQKQYLKIKFQIGERTGKKAQRRDVSKSMRTAKDINGERLFRYGDLLMIEPAN